ncbi:DUF5988 family protein [Streptomyces physcomitrii]|uniref:DUF5988 family protein n=1 Tax=Streptomyces physcomitrii TaxID=2724184 RepID=UPI001B2FFB49|nr:DUF5988 family protein [Streptomyces physcomitrii]
MTQTEQQTNVILRGGPAENYPLHEREHFVADPGSRFKLLRGNRYDHFEASGETVRQGGRELLVLDWSATTYVAE